MKFVPAKVTRAVGRHILTAKKNSPRMFFAAGVVGVVGGTVLACRSTLKLHETLDDINKNINDVKNNVPVTQSDERAQQKELTLAYLNGSFQIVKLYAPALIVTGASIASLTGSHVILTRRNAAITAAYAAVSKSYDEYRDRVRSEVGEERELTLYHASEWQDVPGSDGKIQELVSDPGHWSPYARFFDYTNRHWKDNAEYNRFFVESQQRYANHLLNARGHVFLNEVYANLGFDPTPEGQMVGWVINGDGDGYIDFGVYEAVNAEFIISAAKDIVLDFNVDGVVYDKI